MMPAPGDVDIVIAAELMEAGRAIQRGLVSPDRTTLIASSHRALGILEKTAPGDGIADSDKVAAIARAKAKRFIAHDLQRLAEANDSVISASLFGALAASGALPFTREAFEATIRAGGKGIAPSLAAFSAGAEAVALGELPPAAKPEAPAKAEPKPVGGTAKERAEYDRAVARVAAEFPAEPREMIAHRPPPCRRLPGCGLRPPLSRPAWRAADARPHPRRRRPRLRADSRGGEVSRPRHGL